jgi:iron complex outermembrane recepter protein
MSFNRMVFGASAFALAGALAALPSTALAQTNPTAPQAADEEANNGDIVVTARRREESLQNVPLAVTAFTSNSLREKAISNQDDLVAHTPSLQIRSNGAQRTDGGFFLRGQGSTFGTQPGVVVYTNEVPDFRVPNFGNNTQFYDLENIQVLKGPQGTLFGRSTTGGAVLLTTKKPVMGEIGGFLEGKVGNYAYKELTAALNLPILEDKIALRIAGNVTRRRGFTTSLRTGQYLDNKHRESYRISLLIKPNDWFEQYTIFRGEHVSESGSGIVMQDYNPNFLSGTSVIDPVTGRANFAVAAGRAIFTPGGLTAAPFPLTLGYNQLIGGLCGQLNPGNPAGVGACVAQRAPRIASLVAALAAEEARVKGGGSIRQNAESDLLYLRGLAQQITNITTITPGEFGPLGAITLKNIFATNRVSKAYSNRSVAGAPLFHAVTANGVDVVNGLIVPSEKFSGRHFGDNFSNEIQLGGHSDIVDWLVGYYYNKFKHPVQMGALFSTFNDALDASTPLGVGAIQGSFVIGERQIDKGLFGQVTVRPTQALSVTAGYRKSKYTRTAETAPARSTAAGLIPVAAILPPTPGANCTTSKAASGLCVAVPVDQSATSYNFAIDYKPFDGLLLYVTHRKGFKPGGANLPPAAPVPGAQVIFDPETVKDYEGGVKYSFNMGGVRGHANVAYYHTDYSNIQRNQTLAVPGGTTVYTQTANIAGAKIDGLELETLFNFGQRFQLGFNYNYTKPRYTSFGGLIAVVTEIPQFQANGAPYYNTVSNSTTPYVGTPKHQISVNARYAVIKSDDMGEVAVSGNYYHQSLVHLDDSELQVENKIGIQKGYGTLNLRLEWNDVAGQKLDLALNATNVTQKVYKVGAANLWAALGVSGAIYNEPRMISASARVRF